MITGISIENFRGIRERVELQLRPITLLFGANSAGKSTILHALHYAREIFERRNLSPDQTVAGGPFVDLGGFQNFVHGHDVDRTIRLGFEVDLNAWDNSFYEPMDALSELLLLGRRPDVTVDNFAAWRRAEILISISWSRLKERAFVSSLVINGDGEQFSEIRSDSDANRITLTLNTDHPGLGTFRDWIPDASEHVTEEDAKAYGDPDHSCLAESMQYLQLLFQSDSRGNFFLGRQRDVSNPDALLTSTSSTPFVESDFFENETPEPFDNLRQGRSVAADLIDGISRLIILPLYALQDSITKLQYLGPLRETPSREYRPPQYPDPSRWASGLGAWDVLSTSDVSFVDEVGEWLGNEDRLNSGHRLERRTFKELDSADPLFVSLMTGRAFDESESESRIELERLPTNTRLVIVAENESVDLRPQDVGIGISQVVPVVVTALEGSGKVVAIEQPELHLHPRLQAELGDLFIEAALGSQKHTVILETHSELIPLRLMRRIRESSDDDTSSTRPRVTSKDVAIVYIETYEGATITTPLELSRDGQLLDPWPDGFFEEGFLERFSE